MIKIEALFCLVFVSFIDLTLIVDRNWAYFWTQFFLTLITKRFQVDLADF